MTLNEYQTLAQRTNGVKDQYRQLKNGIYGMCGEAGECIEVLKKAEFHGHELDYYHLAEELGDVLWYVAQTAAGMGITLDEVAERNIHKLKERYPEGFTTEKSIHRSE